MRNYSKVTEVIINILLMSCISIIFYILIKVASIVENQGLI